MARQPESEDGFRLDMSAYPMCPASQDPDPQIGDIYKPRAGQPGFWWIVGITRGEYHHTALYLTFNLQGEIVGQGKAGVHYFLERNKVGNCAIPPLVPDWYIA